MSASDKQFLEILEALGASLDSSVNPGDVNRIAHYIWLDVNQYRDNPEALGDLLFLWFIRGVHFAKGPIEKGMEPSWIV